MVSAKQALENLKKQYEQVLDQVGKYTLLKVKLEGAIEALEQLAKEETETTTT